MQKLSAADVTKSGECVKEVIVCKYTVMTWHYSK